MRQCLLKRRRKEPRFFANGNRRIATEGVTKAKDPGRDITVEDLHRIRERITVKKAQRRPQHRWTFYPLRMCMEYQAKLPGVSIGCIDRQAPSSEPSLLSVHRVRLRSSCRHHRCGQQCLEGRRQSARRRVFPLACAWNCRPFRAESLTKIALQKGVAGMDQEALPAVLSLPVLKAEVSRTIG